jgi:hypothetical protein
VTGACRRVTAAQPIRALLLRLAYPVRFVVFLSACLVVRPVGSGRISFQSVASPRIVPIFFCVCRPMESFPYKSCGCRLHLIQLILILSLGYVSLENGSEDRLT